jgi:hypothetical protein
MSTRHPKSWGKSLSIFLQADCAEAFQSVDRSTALVQLLRRQRIPRGGRAPQFAMAHWGVAMTRANSGNRALRRMLMGFCRKEINLAMRIGGKTEQEILLLRRKFGL